MAISFPLNPSIGDEYTAAGKTWTWNGSQWEGVPATSGIPYGTTASRPANPELGQPYFNADEARLEMYTTATGWQNIVQETPSVVSISGSYLEFGGSQEITINGTNFAAGANVFAVGTNGVEISADYATLVSVVEIKAAFTNLSSEFAPYDIKVANPSNLYGVLYETLAVDETYIWDKQSGTLGTYIEESPISIITTSIFDEQNSPVAFSIVSGVLPSGLSINAATGAITGTPSDLIPNTTYNFTVLATDGNSTATRDFSITINDRGPAWQTSQTLSAFVKDVEYSEALLATDDNGIASYGIVSGSLPTGLSLNTSTGEISGTPTSSTIAVLTVRATDIGGNYADRQFTIPNPGPVWQTASGLTVYSDENAIQLSAIDDSGINPTYTLVSGSLPSGMSLSESGLLSGGSVEVDGHTATFTVAATDNNGVASNRTFMATTAVRLYEFTSHTFKTGMNGSTDFTSIADGGPTLSQVRAEYAGVTWAQDSNFLSMPKQGKQLWTVPVSGMYRIVCKGGDGGNEELNGGTGAIIQGDFSLTAGQKLQIVAGQLALPYTRGGGDGQGAGGGGMSAVALEDDTPLIVAGGGGGSGDGSYHGQGGLATPRGDINYTATGQYGGSGGGSWVYNGQYSSYFGYSWVNGLQRSSNFYSRSRATRGGFGGGAGGDDGDGSYGAGGGGFGGGNGGTSENGGGSYNSGTNQVNTAGITGGTNEGTDWASIDAKNGYVTITKL